MSESPGGKLPGLSQAVTVLLTAAAAKDQQDISDNISSAERVMQRPVARRLFGPE